MITFTRRRVRGGIVKIDLDGRFAGEIATCRWGYGLRLCGVYWNPSTGDPAGGGFTQKGFKRQKDAIGYVEQMDRTWLQKSADFAAERNMVMA